MLRLIVSSTLSFKQKITFPNPHLGHVSSSAKQINTRQSNKTLHPSSKNFAATLGFMNIIFGKLKMKISHFSGNVSWKIPLKLQFRTFHIPWLQKNCAISCAKDRTFSSSIPVRYNPKKYSKIEESCHSSPLKDLEENETGNCLDPKALRFEVSHGVRNVKKGFVLNENLQNQIPTNSFLFGDAKPELKEQIDHDSGAMDFEFTDETEEVFDEPKTYEGKDYHKHNVSQAGKTKQDAEKLAIKLLATRAFTAVELGKKLLGKRFHHDTTEAVINDFQHSYCRGLINDSLYAETFSRSRWSSLSWGPRRIKQELVKKGVSEADTEKALKLVFQDTESSEDQESRVGMSKLSMDHLFVQASKQWLRGQNVPLEKQKSRIIRWLQYRGFNWGVISFILKKLESQDPP